MSSIPGIPNYFFPADVHTYLTINSRNQIELFLGYWGSLPGII